MNTIRRALSWLGQPLLSLIVLNAAVFGSILYVAPPDILDARFYYIGEEAFTFITGLTPGDVRAYQWMAYLDLVMIGVYAASLFLFLGKFPGSRTWLASTRQ